MLPKEDVIHLGELARVRLSDLEIESLTKDLTSILEFVATLQKVPTADVLPMIGGTKEVNILREDEILPPLGNPDELRKVFINVDSKGNLIVPKIFDRS